MGLCTLHAVTSKQTKILTANIENNLKPTKYFLINISSCKNDKSQVFKIKV